MICDVGDVAIVPFPFTDMAVSKYRPALVISRQSFNEDNANTILAMITTARGSAWPSDILLADPVAAGLTQECYVRWKVFTLPNDLLRRSIGQIGSKDRKTVLAALSSTFGKR